MEIHDIDPEPIPILIEDYTSLTPPWARDVAIPSYELISNSYVTYHIILLTSAGTRVSIYRRYSEFDELRQKLTLAKPLVPIPDIPGKAMFLKFDTSFLNQRRKGLEYFLKCIVLNRELAATRIVKQFFSSGDD